MRSYRGGGGECTLPRVSKILSQTKSIYFCRNPRAVVKQCLGDVFRRRREQEYSEYHRLATASDVCRIEFNGGN